jgi:ubiquinone/menaquinone biosynthesis C-methylase UbiE
MITRLRMHPTDTEHHVRDFYDQHGWTIDASGVTEDARRWEDLRAPAAPYVTACRRRVLRHLPTEGRMMLDVASGPIQYPEYLEYSRGFGRRVCADISAEALRVARTRVTGRGAYVRTSVVALPFASNSFDAVVSLHTIYHVDEEQQEHAVRELIRVANPGAPVIIVYANPDRWLLRLKQLIAPSHRQGPIYYHAHPLRWWSRFRNHCRVDIRPWRSLVAQESQRLIPDVAAGLVFPLVTWLEEQWPALAVRAGAYPMIVLTK